MGLMARIKAAQARKDAPAPSGRFQVSAFEQNGRTPEWVRRAQLGAPIGQPMRNIDEGEGLPLNVAYGVR